MRQELATNVLHDRIAPKLVCQTTTRGFSKHLAFRERRATRTEFHRRARPGAKERDTSINQSVRGRLHAATRKTPERGDEVTGSDQ